METDRPVSREWEANYFDYFGWPYYWGGLGMWGWGWFPGVLAVPPLIRPENAQQGDIRQVQYQTQMVLDLPHSGV